MAGLYEGDIAEGIARENRAMKAGYSAKDPESEVPAKVSDALLELDQAITRVEDVLGALIERIEPVCQPVDSGNTVAPSNPSPPRGEVILRVNQSVYVLGILESRIHLALSRLEL